MSNDELRLLSARHLPVRITTEETAVILRCTPEDVHALTRNGLLKPLGKPAPNGKKFYRTKEILGLADDVSWLNKMTNAIYRRWRDKNGSRASENHHFKLEDDIAA